MTVCKSVDRQTLNQRVYESIKTSILNRDLKPGEKLSEVKLAKQLNVSTTPVREAFRMLAIEGLLKMEPYKGVSVLEFSKKEVVETFQCREALELLAFDLTFNDTDKINEDIINKLENLVNISIGTENVTDIVNANSKLHNCWIKGSGNKKLINLISLLDDILLHDRNISAYDNNRKMKVIDEHLEIINALRELNIVKAKKALRNHIKNGCKYSEEVRRNSI